MRIGLVILVVIGILIGLAVRLPLLQFQSLDYEFYLKRWTQFLAEQGFAGFREGFSNYPPFYTYLLFVCAKLPFPWIWTIKAWSILFDFIAACVVYKVVKARFYSGTKIPLGAAFLTFLLPTVVLNGALWGQCDSIYATAILVSVWMLIKGKPILASIAWGVSFSIKPQAIFFLPLLLAQGWHQRRILIGLGFLPLIYFLLALPAWIAGRPLGQLAGIYINQNQIHRLSVYAPNLYCWLPESQYHVFNSGGMVFAAVYTVVFMVALARRLPHPWDATLQVKAALASVLLIPFVLPEMHERYFYLADILSLIYAFYSPRRFYIPILVQVASLFSYFPFLWDTEPVPIKCLAFLNLFALLVVLYDTLAGNRKALADGLPVVKGCSDL